MNFDRLAPHYDRLEALTAGGRLQRVRTAWLESLAGRRRILSAGEGHGRFAEACAARFPEAEICCVEASGGMRERARRRTAAANVRWERADVLEWECEETFDAIVTCFFLDCFSASELAAVIGKLAARADDDALWIVADFSVPASGPARWRAQAIHRLMYAFFRVTARLPARRLTPPDPLLEANGFRLAGRREFEWGLLRADLWRRGPTADFRDAARAAGQAERFGPALVHPP